MAAILAHNRVILPLGKLLDRVADITQCGARPHQIDADIHGLLRDAAQPLRGNCALITDNKHFAGVTMKFVLDHCHINIQDVAIFQLLFARNTMANLMI